MSNLKSVGFNYVDVLALFDWPFLNYADDVPVLSHFMYNGIPEKPEGSKFQKWSNKI